MTPAKEDQKRNILVLRLNGRDCMAFVGEGPVDAEGSLKIERTFSYPTWTETMTAVGKYLDSL